MDVQFFYEYSSFRTGRAETKHTGSGIFFQSLYAVCDLRGNRGHALLGMLVCMYLRGTCPTPGGDVMCGDVLYRDVM